jgi:tRNA pseudouridine55 synthase
VSGGASASSDAAGPQGVLVVDKPAGMTSHDVVARIRRIAGTRRVGHTGTLDPAATGVHVVCLGRATRLVNALLAGTKTYAAVVRLGTTTDSDDLDGKVLTTLSAAHLDESTVCGALRAFQGEQDQIPPMVSAIRVDGERLHVLARRGEVVERAPRRVVIDTIMLDRFTAGEHAEVAFLIACSAGTYVRSVARDLGERLGVGGTLASLRRVANGPFTVDEAVTLAGLEQDPTALERALLTPLDALARAVEVVEVEDPAQARSVTIGTDPVTLGIVESREVTRALVHAGQLLAVVGEGPDGPMRIVWTRPEELR